MTQEDEIAADPFQDPSAAASQHDGAEDATLAVGRDASLTLGTDSLVVLGWFCTSTFGASHAHGIQTKA